MAEYWIKWGDLYVYTVGETHVDFTKDEVFFGVAHTKRGLEESLKELEELGFTGAVAYEKVITKEEKEVRVEDLPEKIGDEQRYYIVSNKQGKKVREVNRYGEMLLSTQRAFQAKYRHDVERILKALDRYGIEGYTVKEVTETEEIIEVDRKGNRK